MHKVKKKLGSPRLLEVFRKHFNEALDEARYPSLHYGRQTKVSQVFGISTSAARKWVMGESLPDTDNLILIADTLNVSVDYLLGRTPKIKGDPQNLPGEGEGEGKGQIPSTMELMANSGMRLQHNDLKLITLSGDEMLSPSGSGLARNDIAVVDSKIPRRIADLQNDAIYEIYFHEIPMVRRLHFSDTSVVIACDNPTYPPMILPLDAIDVYVPGEVPLPLASSDRCVIMGAVKWSLNAPRI